MGGAVLRDRRAAGRRRCRVSAPGVRTEADWRADVARVLGRLARARGVDGLRRNATWKGLLNVVGAAAVEEAASLVADAPTDVEIDTLGKEAVRLLGEHRKIRLAVVASRDRPSGAGEGAAATVPPMVTVVFEPAPEVAAPVLMEDPTAALPGEVPGAGMGVHQAHAEVAAEEGATPPKEAFLSLLPVHSLEALAASLPAGQWGGAAAGATVETLGWVPVTLPGKKLNERMFVAHIVGHSMDDGRSGIRDGAHGVFEFGAGDFDREPVVLVRGAFDDPETGSYAVKRIRQEVGDEGSVARIRLISANPDKTRYPDIVVEERDAAAVTVLARFVAALDPGDRDRRPEPESATETSGVVSPPRATRGRRDVASKEGAEKHRARLAKAVATFFGVPEGPSPEGATPEVGPAVWTASLEMDACDPAALVAVCGPLAGLLSRVKTVTVTGGGETRHVFASNLRSKRWREPIAPSNEPYVWAAVDFEEELAEEMAGLAMAGLAADAATVFRVGPDGVGLRLSGGSVTPGSLYRLVVPPGLAGVDLPTAGGGVSVAKDAAIRDAGGGGGLSRSGWRVLDVEVPSPVPATLAALLGKLGVGIGADAYAARWAVTCPREYRAGRGGEAYPCFGPEDVPVLFVEGPETLIEGDLRVVVEGEGESLDLPLPAGERWFVEMAGLAPGKYVAEVLPLRTSLETTRLFFGVDAATRGLPAAVFDVRASFEGEGASFEGEADLAALGTEARPLVVRAPPFWPVYATWQSVGRTRGRPVFAGEDGQVDVGALLSGSERRRADDPVGDLTIDAGELGAVVLRHRRDLVEAARAALPALVRERAQAVAAMAGEHELLRKVWLEPVLALLGYRMRALPELAMFDVAAGFGATWLDTTLRRGAGFERRTVSVLVIPPARLALSGSAPVAEACKTEALRLCKKLGVDEAIVTNGRVWAKVHARGRLVPTPIDLEDALRRAALGGLDDFLERFLAPGG